jgi:sporulation protein YlmC with PRC-barrel domain
MKMGHHAEILRRFLGKSVSDVYGRNVGNIVGLTMDDRGEIATIGVEHGNGKFGTYDSNHVMVEGGTIVLIPVWKVDAEKLMKEFALSHKRLQALDSLMNEGRITQYVYSDLRKAYEAATSELEEVRKTLIEKLKVRADEVESQIRDMEKFLANIEVQHMTGEIDDEAYQLAADSLKLGLSQLVAEKKDVETLLTEITQPAAPPLAAPRPHLTTAPTELPAPVIVKTPEEERKPSIILRM